MQNITSRTVGLIVKCSTVVDDVHIDTYLLDITCERPLDTQNTTHAFGATVCKTARPMLCCLFCLDLSVMLVYCVLWQNGWTDQDETWHACRPRPWPHCVRMGATSPSPKRGRAPSFRPMYIVAKRSPFSLTADYVQPLWHRAGRCIFVLWFLSIYLSIHLGLSSFFLD